MHLGVTPEFQLRMALTLSKQVNQDVRKVEAASAEMVTEAELSTIRDTLSEVLKKRADDKKVDEELSFSLEDVTYDCKPKRIVPQKPIKPFWFGLKEDLTISVCFRSDVVHKRSKIKCWIVWVPVAYEDFSMGIEWHSLHGFLVCNDQVVNDVSTDLRWVDEYDDPNKAVLMADDTVIGEVEDRGDYIAELDVLDLMTKGKSRFLFHNTQDMNRFFGIKLASDDFVLGFGNRELASDDFGRGSGEEVIEPYFGGDYPVYVNIPSRYFDHFNEGNYKGFDTNWVSCWTTRGKRSWWR